MALLRGDARPLLPRILDHAPPPVTASTDSAPVEASSEHTVDLAHPGRFARLNQQYGRWGLALLEAVVRCADRTVALVPCRHLVALQDVFDECSAQLHP